jgi:hypothetical protein
VLISSHYLVTRKIFYWCMFEQLHIQSVTNKQKANNVYTSCRITTQKFLALVVTYNITFMEIRYEIQAGCAQFTNINVT